ncbi:MAG: type IV pilus twitching motility protein PilT [Opitutales bacterium]
MPSADTPVYPAGGHTYSILDLMHCFVDPDLMADGLPRVSDLHLKVGQPVRYRLDGDLDSVPDGEPLTAGMVEQLLFPLLSAKAAERFRSSESADLDTGYFWKAEGLNFRINAFRDRDGPAFVMRMLPPHVPALEDLGLPSPQLVEHLKARRQGLLLVTGVTGSGKSTTVASYLQAILRERKVRVITLEDPVEHILPHEQGLVSQREVGVHVPSFAAGLRSALRENPDIIVVGEMRDAETIGLALTAAETGHLVVSTLHTRDAKGAITRILDSFPGDRTKEIATQLSFNLVGVLAQKLVPKIDGRGRVLAMEVLLNSGSVAQQIRSANLSQLTSAMETRGKEGMTTLENHLIQLFQAGAISREDALHAANDPVIVERLEA